MRKLIVFIAILLFLFISCKEKEDSFFKEFQSGNYDNVLFLADSKLKDRLSDDALFYKAASYYHEGDYSGASDCAYLYLLIYNDDSSLNLNDYEKALFAVQSKRSSDIIVSSLETLYSSDSLSERFITLMKEAIPLLISRGDQEMLLNLISYGTASDPSYCLYIGDLYFSLGNLEMASLYWNSAAKVFPIQVDLRTRTL